MRLVSAITGQEEAERASGMLSGVLFLTLRLRGFLIVKVHPAVHLYHVHFSGGILHFNKVFFKKLEYFLH